LPIDVTETGRKKGSVTLPIFAGSGGMRGVGATSGAEGQGGKNVGKIVLRTRSSDAKIRARQREINLLLGTMLQDRLRRMK